MGKMWAKFLDVADEVRQGTRPQHKERIDAQPEYYGWLDERAKVMLEHL